MNDLESQERLLDLLTEKTTYGLSENNQQELEELLKNYPEWQEDETFALTAAAIKLSSIKQDEEMPVHLKTKILAESDRYFASRESENKVLDFKSPRNSAVQSASEARADIPQSKISFWNWAGWAVAAAACIVLAVNLWLPRTTESPVLTDNRQTPTPLPTANPPSLPEQRQQLLASAPDIVEEQWTEADSKQSRNIEGDIIWSNSLQKGFVRFRNLPVNDKSRETYQLWIFDANQNAKTPIDGGIFDVDANGDVIVPINAKLKVQKPTMFAVTKEKPGGVVVSSDPERIMAIAKIET